MREYIKDNGMGMILELGLPKGKRVWASGMKLQE